MDGWREGASGGGVMGGSERWDVLTINWEEMIVIHG